VIDGDGNPLLSQRVPNDEPALLQLLANVLELAAGDSVVWATDLNYGGPALLVALLVGHGQDILYIQGRTVHHASKLYRGEAKQMPKTRPSSLTKPECELIFNPCVPVTRSARGYGSSRHDVLTRPRTGSVRSTDYSPSSSNTSRHFERAFDYSRSKAALTLLTKHRTADGVRRAVFCQDSGLAEARRALLCCRRRSSDRGREVPAHDRFRPPHGGGNSRRTSSGNSYPERGTGRTRCVERISGNRHRPRRYDGGCCESFTSLGFPP